MHSDDAATLERNLAGVDRGIAELQAEREALLAQLRTVQTAGAAVDQRLAELRVEREALRTQLRAVQVGDLVAAPVSQAPRGPIQRWLSTAGPQTLLAAGGVLLLAIAALVFTAVAWQDLPALARGGLIAVAAVGSGVATRRLVGSGLDRTAEATAILTVVLLGVLVNGLWQAGLLGPDGGAVFTVGAGGLAGVSHALARLTSTRSPRLLAAWMAPAALVSLGWWVGDVAYGRGGDAPRTSPEADAVASTVLLLALLAAATVAVGYAHRFLADLPRWRTATKAGGVCLWLAATLAATTLFDMAPSGMFAGWLSHGAGVLVICLATAAAVLARRLATRGSGWWDPLGAGGAWLAATLGGAAVLDPGPARSAGLTGTDDGWAGINALSGPWVELRFVIPAAVAAAALWLLARERSRYGAALGMLPVVVVSLIPLSRLLGWVVGVAAGRLQAPWSSAALDTLIGVPALVLSAAGAGIVTALVVALRRVDAAVWIAACGSAVVALAAAVMIWPAAGGVVVAALAAVGAALAVRRATEPVIPVAVLMVATGLMVAFGLSSPAVTISALAVAAAAAAATVVGRDAGGHAATAGLLTADVIGLTAAIVAAATHEPGPVGVAVAGLSAAGWAAAALVHDRHEKMAMAAEVTATAGFAVGIVVAAFDSQAVWLAMAFGVLAVAAAGDAVWRDDRRWLRWVATGAASASLWTILAELDINLPEAYTAPPALVMIAMGAAALRARSDESSWRALGAGLGLLAAPTVLQTIADPDDLGRLVAVIAAGSALAVAGHVWRLQAPLVFGVAALMAVALTQHDVVTDLLPRWLLLATGGTLLLWLSISYERQLMRLAAIRQGLATMR